MEAGRKPRTSMKYPALDFTQLFADQIEIPALIKQLKEHGQTSKQRLNQLIDSCEHILYNQPNVLSIQSPVRIVGDIHGQFFDLLYILEHYGDFAQEKFLFLGDYVDRGLFCVEVMTLLMALKCKYPKNIYLLRGNHQGKTMTEHFNFKIQCARKYDVDVYYRFLELFCKLPLCALVDGKYFCVHGGISPELKKIKQLQHLDRFREIDQSGLMCDLLWSDPVNTNNSVWEKNKIRSCSYVFSKKHADKFLNDNDIEMIIRGHEVQTKGFAFQMSEFRKKLTLTIFSAPNYCDTYKNKGGIAMIHKGCVQIESFSQSPHPFVFPNYMNVLEWSLPIIATKTSQMFLHLLKTIEQEENQVSEDQAQVINKLQCLSKILENKRSINLQLLLNTQELESKEGEEFENLFSQKKINDECQKYPHLKPAVIGPKNLQFKRVRLMTETDTEEVPSLQRDIQQGVK